MERQQNTSPQELHHRAASCLSRPRACLGLRRDFMGSHEIRWDQADEISRSPRWDIRWDRMGFDEIEWDLCSFRKLVVRGIQVESTRWRVSTVRGSGWV